MPRPETFEFSVQEYDQDGSGANSSVPSVRIVARSPLEAAQRVLGENLTLDGPPHLIRAKVWRIGENLQPIATLVYQVPSTQEH